MSTKKLSTILEVIGIILCLIGLVTNARLMVGSGIGILSGNLAGKIILDIFNSLKSKH